MKTLAFAAASLSFALSTFAADAPLSLSAEGHHLA